MTEGKTMRTITTTMRPDEEIEVEEDEFIDLKRQGLVLTGDDEEKAPAKPKPKGESANA
jgi:hypothetical protein